MGALSGYKTYIVGGLMVAKVAIGYALGEGVDFDLLLQAAAVMGLRAGIAKK